MRSAAAAGRAKGTNPSLGRGSRLAGAAPKAVRVPGQPRQLAKPAAEEAVDWDAPPPLPLELALQAFEPASEATETGDASADAGDGGEAPPRAKVPTRRAVDVLRDFAQACLDMARDEKHPRRLSAIRDGGAIPILVALLVCRPPTAQV